MKPTTSAVPSSCDTCPDAVHPAWVRGMPVPWTRQHPAIEIDQERDVVSDDGRELYSVSDANGRRPEDGRV